MNTHDAVPVLESLASAIRLDIYRMLVRSAPVGLVAGELATRLDIAPNKLSFHLKAMTSAGLVSVQAEGRFQRYRANLALVNQLIGYLTEHCCADHPELCTAPPGDCECTACESVAHTDTGSGQ